MAPTVSNPIESKHLRLRIGPLPPIDDINCEKGGALLQPEQKGPRDSRRFPYDCDGCEYAHGELESEIAFSYSMREYWAYLRKEEEQLHPSLTDAGGRAALNPDPKLEKNSQIREFESVCQVLEKGFDTEVTRYIVPYKTQLVDASVLDPAFYNALATARATSNAILKHNQFKTITLKKNALPIVVSSSGGSPLGSSSTALFKKLASESDFFDVTSALESVGPPDMASILCAVEASPTAGAEFVVILDSAASVHVTGDETMLWGYKRFTEPWQIAVADNYQLDVVGVGSIKTPGGSFNIPKVFHVKGLKMNLISVGQLDRDHGLFSGFHGGTCKVMKPDGELVGGGFLQDNNLYALRFLQVPEN